MPEYRAYEPGLQSPTPETFNSHPALSFETQPHLKRLMEVVANPEMQITLFLGAGVSIDAGYPTWRSLLERIASRIEDPNIREIALLDMEGNLRHAETIFRIIRPRTPQDDADILRDALYEHTTKQVPGRLAKALVDLSRELGNRVSLITTNYDDVLEAAFEEAYEAKPSAHSLRDSLDEGTEVPPDLDTLEGLKAWVSARNDLENPEPPRVLHIHGMLRRGKRPLGPVVITESHFLRYGGLVREFMLKELRTRTVIFIGASLDDPNVVGPLWDLNQYGANGDHGHFALHVPGMKDGAESMREARAYGLTKFAYLEHSLGVSPIHLKSYSQLYQVVREMSICAREGESYLSNDGVSPRYGDRYTRAVEQSWTKVLGRPFADGRTFSESFDERAMFSQKLATIVNSSDSPVSNALREPPPEVADTLRKIRRRYDSFEKDPKEEGFGLFLWLRVPLLLDERRDKYALKLAAASSYVVIDDWSHRGYAPIEEGSTFPVAEALYTGSSLLRELPASAGQDRVVWRGTLAFPLRMSFEEGPYRDITVGALAVNTTFSTTVSATALRPISVLSGYYGTDGSHLQSSIIEPLSSSIIRLLRDN